MAVPAILLLSRWCHEWAAMITGCTCFQTFAQDCMMKAIGWSWFISRVPEPDIDTMVLYH